MGKIVGITTRDVAAKAGVSAMTVSLALRNDKRVSEKSKKKVFAAAEELGYRVNPYVSTLMKSVRSRKTIKDNPTFAFIARKDQVLGPRSKQLKDQMLSVISDHCHRVGCNVELHEIEPDQGPFISKVLWNRGVCGLILGPFRFGHLDLSWEKFVPVSLSESFSSIPVSKVVHDNFSGMELAFSKLWEHGFRSPGLLVSQKGHINTRNRWLDSFLGNSFRKNLTFVKRRIFDHPYLEKTALEKWLRKNEFDCLITCHKETISLLSELGYSVPRDLSIIHLDCGFLEENYSGIDQDFESRSETAVQLLLDKLCLNEYGLPRLPYALHTKGKWVDGQTIQSPG
ncbi:LacI family DNA-binding transcriptional regulator [Puniceicoccus vermicola]|uniref:LacI family DNA-binding transcriptional regulator n=1 Tax=Puniceicoccus vermicola TaxID=388746 RepID=A0A7X1E5U2_9BACT|nr:LacI family DNA-binding transcriptional regulator [Puniceicoccus vermicola]MBC2603423.1 LacI family DNA-binding transcriptional regulator [Puniceicoccus vermicola]